MATWKKIVVSGSGAHLHSVTASNGLIISGSSLFSGSSFQVITSGDSTFSGSSFRVVTGNGQSDVITGFQRLGFQSETQLSGSFTGSFEGIYKGAISSSTLSSPAQGQVTLTTNGIAQSATDLGLETTDSPQFVNITLSGNANVNGGSIATNQATFNVATTNASTINVGTTDGAAINLGKSGGSTVTVNDKLKVLGNLEILGTVTEVQVTNINVEDQFILLASGSGTTDAGIIAASGGTNTGAALYHDYNDLRWAVATAINHNATSVSPLQYVTTVKNASGTPTTTNYGQGEMYINTDNGDVWIYS